MKKYITFILCINFAFAGLFGQITTDSQFSESEILLKTPTGDLSGTLTIPEKIRKSPVVIIIAGSGPTDRDCNSPLGVKSNAYKMLAEGFAGDGISTLRFDKRGIGESKTAMVSESDLKFETYIDDVIGWIDLLKHDKRFTKIILLGHSEGSLIGMVAARQTGVSKYISVAGAGRSIDKILKEQLQKQLPVQLMKESDIILDSLKNGNTVSKVNPVLLSLYRPSVQPYMISWLKFDPVVEIKKLRIPVMIIQGTTDIQVSVEDAKYLADAKPGARLLIVDNMNHILKESEADRQKNLATYSNPELPLKSGLLNNIVKFIKGEK